ncbi:MAG: hypothetical protein EOP36_06560 [Rubrivivax sp.]|nr:MAG: hypothetical protein EOP36_06560 [Rubrivivax sp.]
MNKVQRILVSARRVKVAERFKLKAESDDEFHLFGAIIDQFKADANDLLTSLTPHEVHDLRQANFPLDSRQWLSARQVG